MLANRIVCVRSLQIIGGITRHDGRDVIPRWHGSTTKQTNRATDVTYLNDTERSVPASLVDDLMGESRVASETFHRTNIHDLMKATLN
jgi:hypothetical protein